MARQAMDALWAGEVRARTSYAVNDGVVRGYGQVPADDRLVVFHDQRGATDPPALDREGCHAGTPPRQSIEARAYVFVDD